jgi:hypothetical protein
MSDTGESTAVPYTSGAVAIFRHWPAIGGVPWNAVHQRSDPFVRAIGAGGIVTFGAKSWHATGAVFSIGRFSCRHGTYRT